MSPLNSAFALAACSILLAGARAFAQPPASSGASSGNDESRMELEPTRVGVGITAGGGFDGFSQSHGLADTGGSWTARVTVGTRRYLGGELSYIGSAQSIHGLGGSATLVGNGAQAALRFNSVVDSAIQPFAYCGAAWRHYSVASSHGALSDIPDHVDAFELPIGIGIAAHWHGVMFDARGEYRIGWANRVLIPDSGDNSVDRWGVTGNIGYAF
jgi:hypothetical protein